MLGVEAISSLLWQVDSIAWECVGDGLGDMVVPKAELVLVWVIFDASIHDHHCRGCDVQLGS